MTITIEREGNIYRVYVTWSDGLRVLMGTFTNYEAARQTRQNLAELYREQGEAVQQ